MGHRPIAMEPMRVYVPADVDRGRVLAPRGRRIRLVGPTDHAQMALSNAGPAAFRLDVTNHELRALHLPRRIQIAW